MTERKNIPWVLPAVMFTALVLLYAIIQFQMKGGFRNILISDNEPAPFDPANRILRVSPAELFTGELERIGAHLDLAATGCVKLELPGPEVFIGIKPELWQDGKVQELSYGMGRVKEPREASFSLRKVRDDKGKWKYLYIESLLANSGGFSGRPDPSLDVPEFDWNGRIHQNCEKLSEPQELKEGEKLTVWAYTVTEEKPGKPIEIARFKSVEEAAKTARWAFVVKMWWESTETHEKSLKAFMEAAAP